MKPTQLNALLTACSLALSASPVFAQEEIKPASPPKAEKPEDNSPGTDRPKGPPPSERRERHRDDWHRDDRGNEKPEMKPTAYIGVMTQSLSPELTAQTGLTPGFGLLVEEVMADSPAQAAGIKQHDVLVLLGDQKLVNQEQLSALVRAEKKDADLVFTVKRAGAEQKITVKVDEKMMPVASRHGFEGRGGFGDMLGGMLNSPEGERFRDQMRDNAERLRRELQENGGRIGEGLKQFGERMKEWSIDPKDKPKPSEPKFRIQDQDHRDAAPPPPGKDGTSSSSSSSSTSSSFQRNVTRRDDSGEYSLRDDNGAKVFTVKPKNGEEQSFIVNTDKQRQAMPEAFRDKLKELEGLNPPTPEKVQPKE